MFVCLASFTNRQKLVQPASPNDCVQWNEKFLHLEYILLAQPICKVTSQKYRMRIHSSVQRIIYHSCKALVFIAMLDNDILPVHPLTCCLFTEYFVCTPTGLSDNTAVRDVLTINAAQRRHFWGA